LLSSSAIFLDRRSHPISVFEENAPEFVKFSTYFTVFEKIPASVLLQRYAAAMSSIISSASSTFAAAIPTGTISALIGQPPNTTTDYYIAKYLLLVFGKTTDPALGAFIPPERPANYVLEDRGPGILASMSVAIAVMIIVTGLRLGVRVFNRGLTAGWDDLFSMLLPKSYFRMFSRPSVEGMS